MTDTQLTVRRLTEQIKTQRPPLHVQSKPAS